ncbi:MAG: ABC transporter permease [Bacteroidota bacterium]
MIFRDKQKRLATQLAPRATGSYTWHRLRRSFLRHRLSKVSIGLFAFLLFVAVFSDFLANEKPLICKIEGEWQFPVFRQYAIDLGLDDYDGDFRTRQWLKQEQYEVVFFAPIPYSSTYQDRKNRKLVGPFQEQKIAGWRFRHWLGTDRLGRDVLAGLISGTRIALLVGFGTMSIAAFIGILLGSLGGFFGDRQLRVSIWNTLFFIIGTMAAVFYTFISPIFFPEDTSLLLGIGLRFFLFVTIIVLFSLLGYLINRYLPSKKLNIPLDSIVMRLIEIVNSIPALLLLLAVVAIVRKPSLVIVILLLGVLSWTGIARFVRAELLRIRNLEYIQSARALGFSDWRILFRHALPNALSPVLIVIAFGMAGSILAESSLSFLGIGIPADMVSWGSMLKNAREDFSAWWLAIFPGLAIFLTVSMFNFIGDGLTKALDAK